MTDGDEPAHTQQGNDRQRVLSPVTVGVMGSGRDEHDDLARDVGQLLADLGVNLLTGGGAGVMRSVSRAFVQSAPRLGISIGILPASETDQGKPKEGYPNEFIELPIHTHLPFSGEKGLDNLSRNHINVLSCAAVVALPGQAGTAAEVSLALRYGTPVIAYAPNEKMIAGFPQAVPRAKTIDDLRRFLSGHLHAARSDDTSGAGSPAIGPVLETALYVEDLDRSRRFYQRVLGLHLASEPIERMCALTITSDEVLLLFKKHASVRPTVTPFGTIPPTDGDGSLHVAFGISPSDVDRWSERLGVSGVAIESVVNWPEGGRSLYFRDPDNHVIELKSSNWHGKGIAPPP